LLAAALLVAPVAAHAQQPTVRTLGSGFNGPSAVAVDSHGNVFVADTGNSSVKEILAPDYTTTMQLGGPAQGNFGQVQAIVVDATGNVFVSSGNVFLFGYEDSRRGRLWDSRVEPQRARRVCNGDRSVRQYLWRLRPHGLLRD
jgi:hypothetical protein